MIAFTSGSAEAYVTRSKRTIVVNNFGIITVTDNLMVANNGTNPLDTFDLGFPKHYSERLESFEARGPMGEVLNVEREVNESSPTHWLRLRFDKPISSGGTYEIRASFTFSGVVSFDGKEYLFSFPAYPTLPVRVEVCNSTIILPKGSTPRQWPNNTFTPTEIEQKPALIGSEKSLEPFSTRELSVSYSNEAQELVSFRSVRREITVDSGGRVTSKDTYRITNLGGELNALTLSRPRNMSPMMLYDTAGPILERLQVQEDSLRVSPRFGKLKRDAAFTFTLEYDLPLQDSLKRVEWSGRYRFTVELAATDGWVAEQYLTNISLPRGTEIDAISTQPNSTYPLPDGGHLLAYDFGRVPPDQTKVASIDYRYQIFSSSIHPLQWVLSLEAIIGAFAVAILLRRPPKVAVVTAVDKIRRFIELHDEKRALRLELEERSEELARGAITKRDYRGRRRSIEARLSELNRSLTTLRNELKTVDPRYDHMARRLEMAEGEVDALRASEAQIISQYRAGRITKEVHESLTRDMRKRIEKAKETVDSIIVTLREEIR